MPKSSQVLNVFMFIAFVSQRHPPSGATLTTGVEVLSPKEILKNYLKSPLGVVKHNRSAMVWEIWVRLKAIEIPK